MNRIPAPPVTEEWPDADFDLTDDGPLDALDPESDKDDVEDWDIEMDLGETGGAKVKAVPASFAALSERALPPPQQSIIIRPPLQPTPDEDDEEEEGVSTIKMDTLRPKVDSATPVASTIIDEDFESAFALPSDLKRLSLRPLSHQSSKNSLEWGDKDQTSSSSQSSDTYSTLGFDQGSTSSTSTSLPETETEDDDDDDGGELEGLVIPSALFDSGTCGKQLSKILEIKKKAPVAESTPRAPAPDPEDDMEIGLVIDDDADFSPSRLLQNTQHLPSKRQSGSGARTNNISSRPPTVKPTTKTRTDRTKSPIAPPPASSRQLQKIRLSPSPPPRAQPTRTHSYQALLSAPATSSSSFLVAKSGSLRGQKSHSGLKPASPPSSHKRLTRKASLSSLMEIGQSPLSGVQPNPSLVPPPVPSAQFARYDAPTASSRAKKHTSSTSRIRALDYNVPPTRPSTPSSNPAALRLTMPTSSSRLKARPPISSVFPPSSSATPRAASPNLPRPPSSLSLRSRTSSSNASTSAPKVLKKPKRQRLYGDGTELDAFDDLPTDRDKESQYRVQPRGHGSRVAGASREKGAENKDSGKGTLRKKSIRSLSMSGSGPEAPPPRTLKRTGRIEIPPKLPVFDRSPPRKKVASPLNQTRRKPTLIRNLGGPSAPKTVGEMKWNPQTLRWEGNDQALREFDVAMAPARPALITQLTGSSMGSPVGSFVSGARRVGNMIFDPGRMCWISTLSPEDDEPDVFAGLGDDGEDSSAWEVQGGTIRAVPSRTSSSLVSETSSSAASSRVDSPVSTRSRAQSPSDSGSERGSRASMVYDVDDTFLDTCRLAEERHRQEMRGWKGKYSKHLSSNSRSHLYEIRALATRRY